MYRTLDLPLSCSILEQPSPQNGWPIYFFQRCELLKFNESRQYLEPAPKNVRNLSCQEADAAVLILHHRRQEACLQTPRFAHTCRKTLSLSMETYVYP